jgi:hypothetical protein
VRPVVVEVAHVLVEDGSGVSFVVDQHPVGACGADAADEPLRITVRPGRPRRDLDRGNAFGVEDGIEGSGERGTRSRIRKRKALIWSPRSVRRLWAAWVVQAAVGCAVTPSRWTRRVWIPSRTEREGGAA